MLKVRYLIFHRKLELFLNLMEVTHLKELGQGNIKAGRLGCTKEQQLEEHVITN